MVVRERLLNGTSRFGFFSETLVTGLVLFVLCLPLVTILPALAAGTAHLRRHLEGRPDDLRGLWEDFLEALRTGWIVTPAAVAVLGLLGLNLAVATGGSLPGGQVVATLTFVVMLGVVVVALRSAGRWPHLRTWREAVSQSGRLLVADPAGTALVLSAAGLCGVMVWMLLPLLFLVPGLVALALLAVEHRPQSRRIG